MWLETLFPPETGQELLCTPRSQGFPPYTDKPCLNGLSTHQTGRRVQELSPICSLLALSTDVAPYGHSDEVKENKRMSV